MYQINALSLAPDVNVWLANTRQPHILHIFDNVCNLINENKDILSIVAPQVGDGPFNLVVEDKLLFSECLRAESSVSISRAQLVLGDIYINMENVQLWNPRPDWDSLYHQRETILHRIEEIANYQVSPVINFQFSNILATSLANADIPSSLVAAQKLAGLGQGLTPSGDDFMMGAMYAVQIIHPHEVASALTREIAGTAAPLTTSLSASWLKSAGKGEAGIVWHELFHALIADEDIQVPVTKILAVGETSGADALAGFVGTLQAYMALLLRKEATLSGE